MSSVQRFSLQEARRIATLSRTELNGLNGDPMRRASWLRERALAGIVLVLLDRLEQAATDIVEVSP